MKGKKLNLTGQKFGRLTAIAPCGHTNQGQLIWYCKCDCGGFKVVPGYVLTRGDTRSCGCLKHEAAVKRGKELGSAPHIQNIRHGAFINGRHERLYHVWKSMKERCYKPYNNSYKYYGARGIKVCDEWLSDYGAFRKWAIENGYDETAEFMKCTIDRIDANGDYTPKNCRWVDMKIQNQNKRAKNGRRIDEGT